MAPVGVQPVWKAQRFRRDFRQESTEKAAKMDSVAPTAVNGVGTGREIDWHRNRNPGDHGRMAVAFPKIFERHVAAETESDQRDARIFRCRECDDRTQIARFTAMIK